MRSSFSQRVGSILGLTLLCLGTAVAAQGQGNDWLLRFQTPERDTSVQVSPHSIVGSDVRLVRDEEVVRGRAFGRSVFLRLGTEVVDGFVGAQPARFRWREEEETLRLEGTLLGSPVGLQVSPARLTGSVGPCVYDLESRGEIYAGVRVCGTGDLQLVSVWLPSGLPAGDAPMWATALVLLLGT